MDKHFQNLVFFPSLNTESLSNLGIREYDLRCSEMFKEFSLDNLKNTANGKLGNIRLSSDSVKRG